MRITVLFIDDEYSVSTSHRPFYEDDFVVLRKDDGATVQFPKCNVLCIKTEPEYEVTEGF